MSATGPTASSWRRGARRAKCVGQHKARQRLGSFTTGYSVLAGGIVLAVMVFPVIVSVTEEVLRKVPLEVREASLSLGATRWQTTKHMVLKAAFPGIFAAVVLGFSRAFGETMAVLMVVGNVPTVPHSLFDPACPLPALIANSFGEMMSVPLYDSALMFAALLLLVVVLIFNVLATFVLRAVERGWPRRSPDALRRLSSGRSWFSRSARSRPAWDGWCRWFWCAAFRRSAWRALAVEPEVLLGDEATSALDPLSAQQVERRLMELRGAYTIVLVTHILRQAKRLADYVIFLYLGELVQHGPASEVLSTPRDPRTRAYLGGEVS